MSANGGEADKQLAQFEDCYQLKVKHDAKLHQSLLCKLSGYKADIASNWLWPEAEIHEIDQSTAELHMKEAQ